MLFLAPGIWLWGIWAVAVPALIIENQGLGAALRRSQNLVRGTFWRVWGIRALGFGIVSVAGGVVSIAVGILAAAVTGDQPAGLLGNGNGSLSWPYLVIAALGTGAGGHLRRTVPGQRGLAALRRPADAQGAVGGGPAAGRGRGPAAAAGLFAVASAG